jgi:hypothetical protein
MSKKCHSAISTQGNGPDVYYITGLCSVLANPNKIQKLRNHNIYTKENLNTFKL